MTQAVKRMVAGFLCILLVLGCVPMQEINAADLEPQQEVEIQDGEKQPEQQSDPQAGEAVQGPEAATDEPEAVGQEQIGEGSEETQTVNEPGRENIQATVAEKGKLNYIYVESPYLETPAEENIVVSWGDGSENISSMSLVCVKADGSQSEWTNVEREENLFLFNKAFSEKESGTYQFTVLKYVQDDVEYTLDLAELQVKAEFGVNEEYEGYEPYPEDVSDIPLDEVVASVVVLDDENIENAEEEIETTLEDAAELVGDVSMARSAAPVSSAAATRAGTVVVALDPGHGGNDSGALNATYGAKEKDLCLKIAQYAKAELEEYNGVKVVMTRTSDVTLTSLEERVNIAKNQGASLFVSIHLNASNGSAYGAEVWYPNNNYNASVGAQGQQLASSILSEITKLGLENRGIQIRNTVNDKYNDGSLQDYYGVIRYSKLAGFPGIIIEHAFIDSNSDYLNYLNTDAKLKKLGVADATGIANYLGLSKGPEVRVDSKNEFDGTATLQVAGLGNNAKVKIQNGSNKKEYSFASGKGTINFKITDFNGARGTYSVVGLDANGRTLCSTSFYISKDPSCTVSYQEVQTEKQYKMNADFKDMPEAVKAVNFAVWSTEDGQDDLIWYSGSQSTKGKWTATADISKHQTAGTYNIHVYAVLDGGTMRLLGNATFKITKPTLSVGIANFKESAGTFDVVISNVNSPSGVSAIRVPVWCASNQSDIHWYNAKKQSDGKYKVTVSMANHGYATGLYKVHVYITAGNGIVELGGAAPSQKMVIPNVAVSATGDGKEVLYNLKATNVGFLGTVKNVQFATWSVEGGQDDIIWYGGTRNSAGDWMTVADVKKHKTAGKYNVHVYATLANGTMTLLGSTTFEVSKPTLKVEVSNKKEDAGTFDVIISNVKSPSGVSKIQVPVWCATNQSDIKWYNAQKQSDGTYKVTVNMANHNYAVGAYKVHAYITAANGVTVIGGAAPEQKMTIPDMKVSAVGDGKEILYNLKVTNAGFLGAIRNVQFATWSVEGGQDDIIWYGGTRNSTGDWTAVADVRKHKTAGKYNVHVYATLANGTMTLLGSTTFEVSKPTLKVEVSNKKESAGTFDVIITNVKSLSGVSKIQVPVWCATNQSDIKWYDAQKQSDGTYKVTVSMASHNYAVGDYKIHTYITAGNGVKILGGAAPNQKMIIPNMEVSAADKDGKETFYNLKVTNVNFLGAVKNVQFATWSVEGGQDDIVWYGGTKNSLGEWTATADIRKHKTAGKYNVHAYVTLANGTMSCLGGTTFNVSAPSKAEVDVEKYNNATGSFRVVVSGVKAASGVSKVQIPVWCSADQNDIRWYDAQKQSEGKYVVNVDPIYHKYNSGIYKVHVYVLSGNGVYSIVGNTSQTVKATKYYTIMGDSTVTVDQMVRYYKANNKDNYPSAALGSGGASTLNQFCQIYYEEAKAEGVRVEVAFVQAMKETGWLNYGGIVQINQFNFAGIGALDGNSAGDCVAFPDVRTGIRAQIQHLKAYGSTDALVNKQVDPRFHLITRGVAPYVEWLGQKENPTGAGWATAQNYGPDIVSMIKTLKNM